MRVPKGVHPEDVHLEPGQQYSVRMGRLKRFLHSWRLGRRYKFPFCCVLRYCIEDAWDDGKIKPLPEKPVGILKRSNDDIFAPCGIFHHANEWISWGENDEGG